MINRPHNIPSFTYDIQEEMLEIIPKNEELLIGIPKDYSFQENRVPLTPEAVSVLIQNGHQVIIEHNAGENASYHDIEYSNVGALIVYDKESLYQRAHLIIKSSPISPEEIDLLKPHHTIISPVHIPFLKKDMVDSLMKKKITALTFDSIKDDAGIYPIVRAMSEIAGSSAILTAARYLSNLDLGKGILLGGISGVPPAQVVILGAGVVGEMATRTAIGLGASVKIYDNSVYRLMRLQNNIGMRCHTSVIEPNRLLEDLKTAHVAVGALKPVDGLTPVVVTEDMVSQMKAGSVIVDVSIDRGGVFETSRATTHENPIYKKHDVIHYCVPNIPSGVARTASQAISNILMPMLIEAGESGGIEMMIHKKAGIRSGVYLYKGCVTSLAIARRFDIKFTNLELLLDSPH